MSASSVSSYLATEAVLGPEQAKQAAPSTAASVPMLPAEASVIALLRQLADGEPHATSELADSAGGVLALTTPLQAVVGGGFAEIDADENGEQVVLTDTGRRIVAALA